MVAPTEQDATKVEATLRENFPGWDESDFKRVASAVLRKRSRTDKGNSRRQLNQKWEEDGMCTFEDMKPLLVTSNPSQERKRLVNDTAKEYGWTPRKEGKVWHATKEGAVPQIYHSFLERFHRGEWVDPYDKKNNFTKVQQRGLANLLKVENAKQDSRGRLKKIEE